MEFSGDRNDNKRSADQYVLNDEGNEKPDNGRKQKYNPWILLLKLLFRPDEGWKEVKRSKIKPDQFAQKCFYPVVAMASCCNLLDLIYNPDATLQSVIVNSVIIFISYFLGYFLSVILSRIFLPSSCKQATEKNFGKVFVMMSMSTLALFTIFRLTLPMLEPVLVFLSIYTMYIISRGIKLLRVPQNQTITCTVVFIITILGTPYLISKIFSLMMPDLSQE